MPFRTPFVRSTFYILRDPSLLLGRFLLFSSCTILMCLVVVAPYSGNLFWITDSRDKSFLEHLGFELSKVPASVVVTETIIAVIVLLISNVFTARFINVSRAYFASKPFSKKIRSSGESVFGIKALDFVFFLWPHISMLLYLMGNQAVHLELHTAIVAIAIGSWLACGLGGILMQGYFRTVIGEKI